MGAHLVRVLGREELLADICRRLDAFEGVVTLVGEAGIGKTTVWAEVLAGVQSAWSWSATCLEVEAELGLAVLADLYAAAPDEVVSMLPAPQRRALDVVLYRDDPPAEGSITDRLLGVTTLSLLRGLATRGTTVLGIDDVQWCDPTSLGALDYALHRLRGEPVGVLATRRVGGSRDFTGAAELLVGPLADEFVRRIARTAAGDEVDESCIAEVATASGGKPVLR